VTHLTKQHPRGELVQGYKVSDHPLYHTFHNMHARCYNKKNSSYANYGGRGIWVCNRWSSFYEFVKDMGKKPTPFHTLERKNNKREYAPWNCVWATRSTQAVNRRMFESNTSGSTGVKPTRSGKYRAVFDFEGVRHDLGVYVSPEIASHVRAGFIQGFFAARGGLHGSKGN
jgi:hypothetical protein